MVLAEKNRYAPIGKADQICRMNTQQLHGIFRGSPDVSYSKSQLDAPLLYIGGVIGYSWEDNVVPALDIREGIAY